MRRLLIRPGAIGDCILCFPALEHLRTEYTEVWISSPVVPLVHFADIVRSIASTALDLVGVGDLEIPSVLRTQLESFDSVFSWYGTNRAEFRDAMTLLGVNCRFLPTLPSADHTGHAIDFFAMQAGAAAGLVPRLAVRDYRSRNEIVIHPFSGSARKNWPLNLYRRVAEQLRYPVKWTAGPEEELAEAIRFSNLQELANWIAGAKLYIGNDSGITHLAAATGVRVLAIFGPASSPVWTPRGPNVDVLWSDDLRELQAERVVGAANRLLD